MSNGRTSLFISKGEKVPYAALSHCWGLAQIIQTSGLSLQSRIRDIPWNSLSKTFQDAVTVTRLLGLQYLWIDSLCIIQDDALDWTRESGAMASIYEGAEIGLAANEAHDGSHGFLHDRTPQVATTVMECNLLEDNTSYTIKARHWDTHLWYNDPLSSLTFISRRESSPLSTRAWAFQERLLATRYVQFRDREMVWECRTILKCECGTLSRPSQTRTNNSKVALQNGLKSSSSLTALELWPKVVDAYALRQLTKKGDVLPALSGLAKIFQSSSGGTYLAGLWLETLPISLLWEARGVRASPYRAPTWSWASIETSASDSTLISTWEGHQADFICSTVHAASCTPKGSDHTGQVAGGHLIISGKVLKIFAKDRRHFQEDRSPYEWDLSLARQAHKFTFGFHADTILSQHPKDLICLLVAEIPGSKAVRALVLQKVPTATETTLYERVGLIDRVILGSSIRSNNWMFLFENAETRTITII